MNKIKLIAAGALVVILTSCSGEPDPLEISGVSEIDATVTAVDAEARTLALRGPLDNEMQFRVDPEVRNLPQVEVGDTLRVRYYTGYLISIAEPGHAEPDAEIATGQAMPGDRPGAIVATTMKATVEIVSVAKDGTTVSFRDAEGRLQSIKVHREDAQEFASKLKQGDMVDVRYSEAIAVNIEPAEAGG